MEHDDSDSGPEYDPSAPARTAKQQAPEPESDDEGFYGPEDDPTLKEYDGEDEADDEEAESRKGGEGRLDRSVEMEEEDKGNEGDRQNQGTDVVDPREWEVPMVKVTSDPSDKFPLPSNTSTIPQPAPPPQTLTEDGKKRKAMDSPPEETETRGKPQKAGVKR